MILRLCFFWMQHPPSASTHFPYTTLFRSNLDQLHDEMFAVSMNDHQYANMCYLHRVRMNKYDSHTEKGKGKIHFHLECLDRKSTRLNSSHVAISYAVSCLKKKNTRPPKIR